MKRPGLGPRKQADARNVLPHWAEVCGAEFTTKQPEKRPNPKLLTQAAWVAKDEGRYREFHYPAFRARWAEAKDIGDPEVVRGLLAGAGLDGDEALAKAESKAAMERGVFGAPTLFVGDEMFWGNDQFECVRHYIQKAQS